ncbi:MAG: methyltransferase domain-containing protein [Gammaproteobacteria bacterium]
MTNDRNFDDLARRFTDNIYGSPKGRIRLAILQEDLDTLLSRFPANTPLRILDAGSGLGYMALYLAQRGHEVVLCDHSAEMLQRAKQLFAEQAPATKVTFIESPVQTLQQYVRGQFDVVLFHAVLEWVSEPQQTLQDLLRFLRPGGFFSLLFYNRNSLVMRNLLRGNFRKLAADQFAGDPKSLTPTNPLRPEDVLGWLAASGLTVLSRTGVRIIYDYLSREIREQRSFEDILEMERRYCRQEPFIALGRYMHVLAQAKA